MISINLDALGLAAAIVTTSAFFPQVAHTWRRGGCDLSYFMLALFLLGVSLWLVYGILLGSRPIIWANGATALQVLVLFILKARKQPAEVK